MTLSLWFDRLLVSEDDLPYRALAHLGIKPDSTAREVLDASFDMTPEDARDGRINVAGISDGNVHYVARAIASQVGPAT